MSWALTPDELRQRIANWSLESDGQLLQYMVSIAKNLEDKCSKTRDNLNSLMLQVNQTEVKLATATNQFSAVEQVKFVENRVEEDDESFYGLRRRRQQVDEPRKDTQQEDGDERTMDDLIQLAVERSIEGMYKSYEKVTLQLTDSESSDDDDLPTSTRLTDPAELTAGKATIMRAVPKYSFIERPLPHVIGSKEWQNKWHVGLIDSEDESSSDRKEEYSESPSETDDGGMFPSQPNSKNHTPSESESSIWGAEGRKRAPSMDPSVTGDDGSSVYSYASSSKVPRPLPVVAARGISSEGSRLKPPSLFPEEPPEEDVRRRGERGLFDDSPEEDEPTPLPTPQPRQAVPTMNDTTKSFFKGNAQQPARKIVNLFDDEPPEPLPDSLPVPEQKKTINLFIESEDDEEQVKENVRNNNVTSATEKRGAEKVTAKKSLKPAGPALTNPRAMTKLVDELNNNFRRQQEQPAPEKTKPVPEDNSRARSLVTNIFDDEPPIDDFDRLFIAANPTAKPAVRQTILPQPTARVEKEKKPINLFAEDDEDDYDGIVVGSNETRPQKSPSQGSYISPGRSMIPKPAERLPTVKKISIFDESDSEEGTNDADSDLFGSTTKKASTVMPPVQIPKAAPKVIKSIFSDSSEAEDDDDEALFGKSSSILKNKLDALKKNGGAAGRQEVGATSKPESKPTSKSKSLFDEDSDEDAQDVKKDDDLFGSVSKPAAPLALNKKTVQPAPKKSIFNSDSESEEDDSIFGAVAKSLEKSIVSTAEPKVSAEVEKSELNHAKETPRETNDDAPTIEEKQSIEKEAIVVEEPKSNVNENGDNSIAQNSTLESSEPKSALNFSPIGLFDDVPPPDDGDETDDVTHPKQSASVESTLPPILDEASSYSQESQSLDFIPTGSAGGNRSRYLFDDEPPPDEADDSSANLSFAKPSAFKVGSTVVKGFFDNPAPASLPPMVEDSRSESSKPIRPKVNKLNAKLAINVAALLPGARRPMPASSSPEKQHASTVTSVSKGTPETTAEPAQSEEAPNSGKLTGLNKGRARIPTKRKPPSRQTLRAGSLGSSLQRSVSEEERNEKDPPQSSAADDRIVVGSEGKVEHVEAGLPPQDSFPPANHSTVSSKVEIKRTEDSFVDRLSASVRNPSKRVVLPDGNDGDKPPVTATVKKTTVKPSNTSLFGDSDGEGDDDDFFSKLPTKGVVIKKEATKREGQRKPVGSRSIFGSDDENEADGRDDDLFGTKKSSIAGQLKAKVLDVSMIYSARRNHPLPDN
uniref:CAP-ZIP_m domain-containing protein n=1 Tax=Anopheles melas TaxID=34690 RepID=A0A182TLI3_9DIPT